VGEKKRIVGVLTGGGDCPGLNAVIRAVVKATVAAGMDVIGIEDGFKGLIENRMRRLALKDVSGLLPRGGTILGTTNRDNPFRYPVEVAGETAFRDVSKGAIANLVDHGVSALIVIGGDGTLSIARDLSRKGVNIVGVPKTIDNDLSATDVTFGFDTALVTATEALDRLHSTAESHHRIMILELMGRYAGWIALEAGLAGGADVILIPEIPFKIWKVVDKIKERRAYGKKFSIVVVAEGAAPVGGQMVVHRVDPESPDPIRLGGIGEQVGRELEELTKSETRVIVLGHLQRGGSPTPFDRILATRYGTAAVRLVQEGRFGEMVALRGQNIVSVPLDEAVGTLRRVPDDSDFIRAARAMGVSFGDGEKPGNDGENGALTKS
jgi:6-phosphofructokinase 1